MAYSSPFMVAGRKQSLIGEMRHNHNMSAVTSEVTCEVTARVSNSTWRGRETQIVTELEWWVWDHEESDESRPRMPARGAHP